MSAAYPWITLGRRPFYAACRALLHGFFRAVTRLEVEGAGNVPRTGGVILAPNHTSYADPPFVAVGCRRPVWFMGKAELFRIFGLGRLIKALRTFPVTRGAPDRRALRTALYLLENGQVLCVFPEGGRSPDGRLLPAEPGLGFMAARAQVPVVPVALMGSREFLPPGSAFPHFAKVKVRFGQPIFPPESHRKDALLAMGDEVMGAIASLMGVPAPVR